MDLALNYPQRLICHKTKQTNHNVRLNNPHDLICQKPNQTKPNQILDEVA